MRATHSKKKVAALCLAAALAGAAAAPAAHAASPAGTAVGGLLAEMTALWDAWKPWGESRQEEQGATGPATNQSSGEPELGPYAIPNG